MIKSMPSLVFISTFIDCFIELFLILHLMNIKIKYTNKRFIITLLIISIYAFMSYMITDNFIRLIMLFFIELIGVCYISKVNKKEWIRVLINTFAVWLVLVLVDILFNILVVGVLKVGMNDYRNNIWLVLSVNFFVLFIVTCVFYDKKVRNLILKISDIQINYKNVYIFIIILISVVFFSIIFYLCIFLYNHILILCVTFVMVVIYAVVTLITIREFNLKNKLKAEYEILLTNLSEYEKLLDRQRILNHENKNQLLAIKGMLDKSEKVNEYINTLIDTEYQENDNLILQTNRIPSGGLKGLIYYKMLTMKENNINVSLEVDHNISNINFDVISTKINQELCKIVGVFLDNAIQEVTNLSERYINIIIEMINDEFVLKISNNYQNPNVSYIGEKNFTTKGSGHGYGLKLVKTIVSNNNLFEHKTEINGKVFSQIIKLKIKN